MLWLSNNPAQVHVYAWYHNHGIMWLIHMSYWQQAQCTYWVNRSNIISLAVCQPLVQYSAHAAAQTLNLLLHRPHPSMQVNSSCLNSPLQWRRSSRARTSNLPPDYDKEQTSSRFIRGLVACAGLSKSAPFIQECISMAGHPCLCTRHCNSDQSWALVLNLLQSASFMPSRLGHGLYKKNDRLKNIFRCSYIV